MAKKKRKDSEKSNAPQEKDDGTRWIIVDPDGVPYYLTFEGTTRREAQRIADGLAAPAGIRQIK